jgi:hypothetical protein
MSSDLLDRLPQWELEADALEAKARALRQMVEAVRVLNGDAARLFDQIHSNGLRTYPGEPKPRGREAVRRIVSERPGIWRVQEIKQQVKDRGWPSSPSAIETAVKRLSLDGEAKWVSRGVYQFGLDEPRAFEPATPTDLQRWEGEA